MRRRPASESCARLLGLAWLLCAALAWAAGPQVVQASDGRSQITMPEEWLQQRGLHDNAEIQIGSRLLNQYLIVVTEAKGATPGLGFEDFVRITQDDLLEPLVDAQAGKPYDLTIGGLRARQFEVRGSYGNTPVAYLHTAVEGREAFFQIVAWCRPADYGRLQARLKSIVDTFREIAKP